MATIKGGKVKSIALLKSSLKKGAGGSQYLSRVPADDSLTVRFLTEPTEWITYFEHYDQVRKFYPCTDECPGCTEGERPSARYLCNALDVSETRVIPLVMPKSMAGSILKKYEKYATILDRDYELSRSGTGLDTEYDVTPEPPTKMNIDRFDLIDLMAILEGQLEMADSTTSDEEDEEEDAPKPSGKKPARKTAAPVVDDEDEDEDEDEEEEDDASDEGDEEEEEESEYTAEILEGKSLKELRQMALDLEWTPEDIKGMDKDAIIEMIVEWAESDEEEEEDDEEEELTEEELRAMSLGEVKTIAKEMGVRFKVGTSKDDIIDLIIDASESADDEEEESTEDLPF